MLASKKKLSLKGLKKTLRIKWKKGALTDFDELLSRIAEVDLDTASLIRESWEDLGILGYDSDGCLCWCNGWMKR